MPIYCKDKILGGINMNYKKLTAGLMALAMVFAGAGYLPDVNTTQTNSIVAAAADEVFGDFTYVKLSDHIRLKGYSGSSAKVEIPSQIEGLNVTEITMDAFKNNTAVETVIIPNTVQSIGLSAFQGCTSLKNVSIPDSVTEIQGSAFRGCTALEELPLPNSLWSIESSILADCTALKTLTIPGSVKEVGFGICRGCTSLTDVTISDGVETVGKNAFYECTSLKGVTVAPSVKAIGSYAFYKTPWLQEMYDNNDYVLINNILLAVKNAEGEYTVPEGTEYISSAFTSNGKLTKVTIPDSVKVIGDHAFDDCTNMVEVDIKGGVELIDEDAFFCCFALETINFPNTLGSINQHAFWGCKKLKEINLPDSVVYVGSCAFRECEAAETLTLSKNVKLIENETVSYNSNITKFEIPEGVETLSGAAFFHFENLQEVTIPQSVTKIGKRAIGYLYNSETREYEVLTDLKIYGYTNTAAETYANENGFEFIALGEGTPKPAEESSKPEDSSSQPIDESSKPDDTSSQPVDESSKPDDTSSQTDSNSSEPDESVVDPIDDPLKPPVEPLDPGELTPTEPDEPTTPSDPGNTTDPGLSTDTAVRLGDVNQDGVINVKDSVIVTAFAKQVKSPSNSLQKFTADVNQDGNINVKDSVLVTAAAKNVKKLTNEFAVMKGDGTVQAGGSDTPATEPEKPSDIPEAPIAEPAEQPVTDDPTDAPEEPAQDPETPADVTEEPVQAPETPAVVTPTDSSELDYIFDSYDDLKKEDLDKLLVQTKAVLSTKTYDSWETAYDEVFHAITKDEDGYYYYTETTKDINGDGIPEAIMWDVHHNIYYIITYSEGSVIQLLKLPSNHSRPYFYQDRSDIYFSIATEDCETYFVYSFDGKSLTPSEKYFYSDGGDTSAYTDYVDADTTDYSFMSQIDFDTALSSVTHNYSNGN